MQHVFFDLDGTLTDPAPGIVRCYQHALQVLGAPPRSDAELTQLIGPPLQESFRALMQSDDPELCERAVRVYRERFSTLGLYENSVYPEMPEVLSALRDAGRQLWVVTSKPTVFADRIIDHFALRPFFTRVYGAELSGERAAKAELIAHVLASERIAPQSTCMIGDRKHDVIGAKAHGIAALGVLWGYGTRLELEEAGATLVLEAVREIPAAIERLTSR